MRVRRRGTRGGSAMMPRLALPYALVIVAMMAAETGCVVGDIMAPGYEADESVQDAPESSEPDGGFGGANEPIIHMPFQTGTSWLCTQGANGSYSHQYNSTRYDVDLDTPNNPADYADVYAPVSGTVYLQYEPNGFGFHANIDMGDGTYVVLGHLDEFLVGGGTNVSAGALIGKAGCTGSCTGEHVHLGVHEGDANRGASQGTSIPFRVFSRDSTAGGGAEPYSTSEMVCGLSSGHRYESQLPTGNAQSGSSHDDDVPCDDDDASNSDDDDSWDEPEDDSDDDDDDTSSDDDDDAGQDDDDASSDDDDDGAGNGQIELCWHTTGRSNVRDA
ncbi:MAG: M23 family metallopeptidase, partial [Patescibacteria group bacterium]